MRNRIVCLAVVAILLTLYMSTIFVSIHDKPVINHSCDVVHENQHIFFLCDEPYDWTEYTFSNASIYQMNSIKSTINTHFVTRCRAQRSCFESTTNNLASIYCDGSQSCAMSIIEVEIGVFCDGTLSCSRSVFDILDGAVMYGSGSYSFSDSIIYIHNININTNNNINININTSNNSINAANANATSIILDGYKSGNNLTVVLTDPAIRLSISCQYEACVNTKIICINCVDCRNIEIRCTNPDLSFCPVIIFTNGSSEISDIHQFIQTLVLETTAVSHHDHEITDCDETVLNIHDHVHDVDDCISLLMICG